MKILLVMSLLGAFFFSPLSADDSTSITKPSDIPIEAFAKLNNGQQMEMSPSATHFAYISPYQGRKNIFVESLNGGEGIRIPPVKDADISWFTWKGDDILLISYRYTSHDAGRTYATTQLVTYNLKKRKMKRLFAPKKTNATLYDQNLGNVGDSIVDFLRDDPDKILLELDADADGDTRVYKINVKTLSRPVYFNEKFEINSWASDEQHKIRWGSGYKDDEKVVRYLNPVTDKWDDITEKDWYTQEGISPIRFFDDPRYAYVYQPTQDGLNGLAKFDLVVGRIVEPIFNHQTVDIDGLATSPESGKVIGVRYTEDYPQIHFFNKSYKKLYSRIQKALGEGWISILSMNKAKKVYLIKHMSSKSAGEYYYLNRKTGALQFLMSANEHLAPGLMSQVKPISYPARDGHSIPGYLTLPKDKEAKNLPTIILPHGGPSARDSMRFDIWVQFLASRGYAVLQPNFRGSTGYGDNFKKLGEKQWGGTMQDDVTDGTQWLIDEGIADPDKICIAGLSYGGYVALMGAVKEPNLYTCAVSINGVADLNLMVVHDNRFVGGEVWSKNIGLEGEDIKTVSPYHRADEIKVPVLIVHAKDDPVVPYGQAKNMYKKLKKQNKKVTYVEVKNGDHYLDTEETRLATFKAMEKFLKEHLD